MGIQDFKILEDEESSKGSRLSKNIHLLVRGKNIASIECTKDFVHTEQALKI